MTVDLGLFRVLFEGFAVDEEVQLVGHNLGREGQARIYEFLQRKRRRMRGRPGLCHHINSTNFTVSSPAFKE